MPECETSSAASARLELQHPKHSAAFQAAPVQKKHFCCLFFEKLFQINIFWRGISAIIDIILGHC